MNIIILLCVATIALSNPTELKKKTINPYDLEDEIRQQLDNLRYIVRGAISVGVGDVDRFVTEVYRARDAALSEAQIDIEQEYEALSGQVTAIKNLAQSAGADIEVCLVDSVPALEELPTTIIDSLRECLAFSNREVTIIQNDSTYRLHILMNEVNIYDFQIEVCAGDLLCLAPLVEEIELAMIRIPQKIDVEVLQASESADQLKVLVAQCTVDKVAQFNTEGGIIVKEITECANEIITRAKLLIIILLCVATVISSNPTDLNQKSVKPYDLEDEIQKQLETLRNLVVAAVYAAEYDLATMGRDLHVDREYAQMQAESAMYEENERVSDQINNIKLLAEAAAADIDVCLVDNVPKLEQLLSDMRASLKDCLTSSYFEWVMIQTDSRYRLNILMNEVTIFDFQLEVCAGDLTCLETLFTQIELAMTDIPQKIQVELVKASELHDKLKATVYECNESKAAQFITEAGIIGDEVTACANDILS